MTTSTEINRSRAAALTALSLESCKSSSSRHTESHRANNLKDMSIRATIIVDDAEEPYLKTITTITKKKRS
jgi:uncharacterized OsmC-like protein